MIEILDQLGRPVRVDEIPERVISLVPSQTELLSHLDLGKSVVGITKFCVHPRYWFETKTRIGGTKNPDLEKIRELNPDLVLANKEENRAEDISEIEKFCPVYVSDVNTVEQALNMIADVGALTGMITESKALIDDIGISLRACPQLDATVCYLIWREPYMAVGSNTFIGHVLEMCGFRNVIEPSQARYVELDLEELANLKPDYFLLSTEPFPFSGMHCAELSQLTGRECKLVDGEIFSWYGPRMLKMAGYFGKLQARLQGNLQ